MKRRNLKKLMNEGYLQMQKKKLEMSTPIEEEPRYSSSSSPPAGLVSRSPDRGAGIPTKDICIDIEETANDCGRANEEGEDLLFTPSTCTPLGRGDIIVAFEEEMPPIDLV